MDYSFSTTLDMPFADAIGATKAALAAKGFGVLTTIDLEATMREKLDVAFRPYVILGACNPKLAYRALQAESRIGTMLPCNVIVQQLDDGQVEVAAIDPMASMMAVENSALPEVAAEVQRLLREVVESL